MDAVSRVGMILREGVNPVNVLVLHPQTTVWTLFDGNPSKQIWEVNAGLYEVMNLLEAKHISYHFGDEIMMERYGRVENGKLIKRHYNIWVDNEFMQSEAGRISESYLTRWETINSRTVTIDGVERNRLDLILEDVKSIYVDYMEENDLDLEELEKELAKDARSLIAAVKADCADGNMAQSYLYHSGSFRMEDEYSETGYRYQGELGISISGEKYSWWVSVYPDSVHTLRWLADHGVLVAEITDIDMRW